MQGKKEEEQKRERAALEKMNAEGKVFEEINEADITAEFDAADDVDVVF